MVKKVCDLKTHFLRVLLERTASSCHNGIPELHQGQKIILSGLRKFSIYSEKTGSFLINKRNSMYDESEKEIEKGKYKHTTRLSLG